MTALSLNTRLESEVFAGNYQGPLYAPHPDLKERRAELGLPTPESGESVGRVFEVVQDLLSSDS